MSRAFLQDDIMCLGVIVLLICMIKSGPQRMAAAVLVITFLVCQRQMRAECEIDRSVQSTHVAAQLAKTPNPRHTSNNTENNLKKDPPKPKDPPKDTGLRDEPTQRKESPDEPKELKKTANPRVTP